MSERAAPFYCPYCGDEDLRPEEGPAESGHGYAWACGSCARVFRVRFVGLRAAAFGPGPQAPGPGDDSDDHAAANEELGDTR